MKIQEKIGDNYGEMCLDCGHARKYHWIVNPYKAARRIKNYKLVCQWNLDLDKCEQKDVCGCVKRKSQFCCIGGI